MKRIYRVCFVAVMLISVAVGVFNSELRGWVICFMMGALMGAIGWHRWGKRKRFQA